MNKIKFILTLLIVSLMFGCSEEVMDDINEEQSSNNPTEMTADNMLPDIMLKSGYETAATDIAWYASVYVEQNAGVWNQLYAADRRNAQESASLMNNSWNSLYDVMNICDKVFEATHPETGIETLNSSARGVAQILMAYNLAVTVNFWGDAPYEEAFQGNDNLNPKYDDAEDLYDEVHDLLDRGIANLEDSESLDADDYIYDGSIKQWIKAANALKARYSIMLSNVDDNAAQNALDAIEEGFEGYDDNMAIDAYGDGAYDFNPWVAFYWERNHHAVSTTFEKLLEDRGDPRQSFLIYYGDGRDAAPIGEADQSQSKYAKSYISSQDLGIYAPTTIMTYHEQKFIEAEAQLRTDGDWETALQEAIEASFDFYGLTYFGEVPGGSDYAEAIVQSLDGADDEVILEEIMTQKYIAMYEYRSMTAYNDYRRTGYPEMHNPNNDDKGFPHRYPYALSETQSNPDNVPDVSIYEDKLFWAKED